MKPAEDSQKVLLENVWKKDVSPFRAEVLEIWRRHGGGAESDAQQRLEQLVFLVRNASGEVVGISTAFKAYVKHLRNHFYAFRLLLVPGYRIPGLTSKLLVSTRDFLESIYGGDGAEKAIGMITLVENEAIKENRNEAIWPASKMVYIGNSKEGNPIRVYYFKGARILP
jgi:hypothetical protein